MGIRKLERNIDKQIRNHFKHRPDIIAKKRHGTVISINEPDWEFCVLGRTIVIEMKVPGEEERPAQALRLREWQAAGARTAVCTSLEAVIEIVNEEEARWRRLLEYEAESYT